MKTPVAIVGGGPGGTSCAMFLAQRGIDSVVIEKESFPRFHIGESMTGECGNVMRDLGLESQMLAASHPVKRAVTVYGPSGQNPWTVPVMARSPEGALVEGFTWQVRRSAFDQMLFREAAARGVTMVSGRATAPIRAEDGSVRGVRVETADGGTLEIESEVLVDASGQANFLSRAGVASPKVPGTYDKQIAVFSQVRGALREEGKYRDSTLVFYKEKFHWAWFIPLDEEVVSVGIVLPGSAFTARDETKHDFLVRELRELNPDLARRIPEPSLIEEARAIPNYSFRVESFTGKGWICLGDAHRFIDPIFSFGLYVTTKEAQLAAGSIERYLGGAGRDLTDPFAAHRAFCEMGLGNMQAVIDGFWEQPLGFAYIVHRKHRDDMVDLLAGRVYQETPSPGLRAVRSLAAQARPAA